MDREVKIKEEPAWLEGTTNASLENIEHVPEVIALKEDVKSELTEAGAMQENSLEPSEEIKGEIFIEEHTDDQLLPYIKEETKSSPKVSNADHQSPDGGAPCFRCHVCGEFLAGKLGLLRHLKRHKDDRPFRCEHCGQLFGSRSNLLEHLRTHPLLVCEYCQKCFTKINKLTEHVQLHTRGIANECSVCQRKFRNSWYLTKHMLSHKGFRSLRCYVCGKFFNTMADLAAHMQTHTAERP